MIRNWFIIFSYCFGTKSSLLPNNGYWFQIYSLKWCQGYGSYSVCNYRRVYNVYLIFYCLAGLSIQSQHSTGKHTENVYVCLPCRQLTPIDTCVEYSVVSWGWGSDIRRFGAMPITQCNFRTHISNSMLHMLSTLMQIFSTYYVSIYVFKYRD